MDVGTAKPSLEERKLVRHHFVDELEPDQPFSAGEFGKSGRERIAGIIAAGKTAVVVGGSGLYIRALVDGFFSGPGSDPDLRETLTARLKEEGPSRLHAELKLADPETAAAIHPQSSHRLLRALELYYLTGAPASVLRRQTDPAPFEFRIFGLRWKRNELYDRINRRVDEMFAGGFVEETKKLLERGYSRRINALQTVGYKEILQYLDGKLEYDAMVELVKQNTRRYAKRQLTWFRADERIVWIDMREDKPHSEAIGEILRKLEEEGDGG